MGNRDDRLIDRIEKLIRLSNSNNEHEARAAMMKARELMAKHHIRTEDISPEEKENEIVECSTTLERFRESWVSDLATIIAENFRCRILILRKEKDASIKFAFMV